MDGEPETTVVLGSMWDKQEDVLLCDVSAVNKPQSKPTRRSILSAAQRVFDPLGFCCPVTLDPKLLLRECWNAKLSWDAEVPEEISRRFIKWVEDLPMLTFMKIPRWVRLTDCRTYSLHTFAMLVNRPMMLWYSCGVKMKDRCQCNYCKPIPALFP
jgi:hypothetical protein